MAPSQDSRALPDGQDLLRDGAVAARGSGMRHVKTQGALPHTTPNLLELGDEELERVWPRGGGGGLKAVFLDYDGTLRELEARPEMAVPTQEVQKLLAALDARKDLAPHIISGRDAHFLRDHFGAFPRITLIAEHERRVAGRFQVWRPRSESQEALLQDWKPPLRREIEKFVARVPGSHLEEKESSLVWHYRQAASGPGCQAAAELVERLNRLKRQGVHHINVCFGHKVIEVSTRKLSKGEVMRKICEERAVSGEPFASVLVAGDDVSDESMFEGAPPDFLTIKVGQAATLAKFRVDAPEQLRDFLWRVAS